MKTAILPFLISCILANPLSAQGVKIGTAPGQPSPDAGLEVSFPDRGFLLPRLSASQIQTIPNPSVGLQVFNTSNNCLQIYLSTGWRDVVCECPVLPNAGFNAPPGNTINTNQSFSFSASQSGLNYQWSFQGGTPAQSTSSATSVSWSSAGTYVVSLTVTDANGCSDSSSIQLTINQFCDPNPPGTLLLQSSAFCDPNPPAGWTQCAGWINTSGNDVSNTVLDGCLNSNNRLRIRVWNDQTGVLEEDVFSTDANMSSWMSWNYHGGNITRNVFTNWVGTTTYFSSTGGGSACQTNSNCGQDAPCGTLTLGTGMSSVILAPGNTNGFEYRMNCNGQALTGRRIAVYR